MLYPDSRVLYPSLVRPFARLIRDIKFIIDQGCKSLYCVNCGSDHSLASAKEDHAMYEIFISILCCANFLFLGVAVFFVLQFVMLIMQAYWVCELAHTEWKQTPGSMCVLPKVVPITQVVSKLLPPLVTPSVCSLPRFSATVISDSILIAAPLMVWRTS